MQLVQSRIVTGDVHAMATFYAELIGVEVTLNDFYVEMPTGSMSVGFSRCRFTEEHTSGASCSSNLGAQAGETILDFVVDDVDAEYERIDALGVEWVLPPTTQPWGRRAMLFRDPEGRLISVLSRHEAVDR
jgi:predicted enzyme related to lactoylglutathione lyase